MGACGWINRFRLKTGWQCVGAMVFFAVLAATPADAAASRNVFEVAGVAVDVTAETAAKARGTAVLEGERLAFRRLLERLTLRADHERLPNPPPEDIRALIRDFAVTDEKTSAVRYLAKLTFHFKPSDIRALLRANGIPFAETQSKPVVVLPVYQLAGDIMLWEDNNPWRETWLRLPPSHGLTPLAVPLGDLQDIAQLRARQALDGDAAAIGAIANRYGAGDGVVAFARVGLDAKTGTQDLLVTLIRHGPAAIEALPLEARFASRPGESMTDLFGRAVEESAKLIEDDWKLQNVVDYGRKGILAITIPVQSLRDWVTVQRRLGSVPLVTRVEKVLMSITEVRVNLHHVGGADKLITALQQADMSLAQEAGEWILIPAGGEVQPAAPTRG